MTLVQLRHFVVVADIGSFAQASAALFLTQPALTRSIQSLELELGGTLFDRLGRRIALTPFGREVLNRARLLVSDAETLRHAGKALHAGLIGTLRVGLSSAPGALLSTPLMRHMAEHHPRLKVEISRSAKQRTYGYDLRVVLAVAPCAPSRVQTSWAGARRPLPQVTVLFTRR